MKDISKGWVEGSVEELLELSDAESACVEAKVALTCAVRGLEWRPWQDLNLRPTD